MLLLVESQSNPRKAVGLIFRPNPTQSNPTRPDQWLDPTHVQLCAGITYDEQKCTGSTAAESKGGTDTARTRTHQEMR